MNVRQIIEKLNEVNIPVVLCFVDYAKACDCVNWQKLFKVLREIGVPAYLVDLVESLYEFSSMMARVAGEESEAFQAEKGVRQGCILSSPLLNIYGEHIIRVVLEHWTGGISIGGRRISNLRYANDNTLIAQDEEEMVKLVNLVRIVSEKLGLCMNASKMKVMLVDWASDFQLLLL